jgi:hypothetical protein
VDTLVELVATLVVALAAAALSLFGVRAQADHAPRARPPVISRTADARPLDEASRTPTPLAVPAPPNQHLVQPMAADCPMGKARRSVSKA